MADADLDRRMLDLAARLALRGLGDVEPNPMVGCVIARAERVLALGHHRRFGGPHAEREALADASRRGVDVRGATMYVTLEPCVHFGKQPPCVDAVIASGVARVVVAVRDPNPVAAGGIDRLRAAGIDALHADAPESASALARATLAPFLKRVATGLPFVIAKWAQTIDGRVATRTGESRWISGPHARRRVHALRARVDAVLTGIGTVRADDPLLTARGVRRVRRPAARVVLDSALQIDPACALVRTARLSPPEGARTVVLCQPGADPARRAALEALGVRVHEVAGGAGSIDLRAALRTLAEREGIATCMLECGPTLLGAFADAGLIDAAVVYIAPTLLADERALPTASGRDAPRLSDARRYTLARVRRCGEDLEVVYLAPTSAVPAGNNPP